MGFTKSINWRKIELSESYWRVLVPADSYQCNITLGVYTCKESADVNDQPLYTKSILVDPKSFAEMFSEYALQQENVTAKSQSYTYVKSLEEFAEVTDVLEPVVPIVYVEPVALNPEPVVE